jgi:hypothetical protein
MRNRIVPVGILLLVIANPLVFAKKRDPQPDPAMAEITARGRMLFECDQAAWHATDAVQATNPAKESVGRYVARKSDTGWVVAFGHLNDTRDKFLVAYEATQGVTLQEFTVKKVEPPREDASFYLFAARAIDTALHDFRGEKRPYNVAVLPAPPDRLYVYVLPAQTENGVYPLGGDARYLVSTNGNTIVEKRQMHKTILENRGELPKGTTPAAGFHTHVLSDVPEDSDVFYVLTRKPPQPEYIGTRSKKLYTIQTDGTILEGKL